MISQKQLSKNIRQERRRNKTNKFLQESGIIISPKMCEGNPSEKELKSIRNRMKRQGKRGFQL